MGGIASIPSDIKRRLQDVIAWFASDIRRRFGKPAVPIRLLTPYETIAANPQEYSRAVRRKHGYIRPVSLLTEMHSGLEVQQESPFPRYVRRHGGVLAKEHTRRNRKARARIIRSLRPTGMLDGLDVDWSSRQ